MATWISKDRKRFSVTHEGIEIPYDYRHDDPEGIDESLRYAHFEFRSEAVSKTGYYSHFAHVAAVEQAGGHQAYAKEFVKAKFRPEVKQIGLF